MSVKSSEKVFDVLRVLTTATDALSAPEIASMLEVPLTSTIRALSTLEAAGYAKRANGAARFELGGAGQMLAYAFISQFPLRNAVLPYLQQLTSTSRVSCSLFQRYGGYVVRIAFIAGTAGIINIGRLGEWRALNDGAAGLSVLAKLEAGMKERILGRSGATAAAIKTALLETTQQGFAWAPSKLEQGGYDFAIALPEDAYGPVGSVVIEGVSEDALGSPAIEKWTQIIHQFQQMLKHNPTLLLSPFGQADLDGIHFGNSLPALDNA